MFRTAFEIQLELDKGFMVLCGIGLFLLLVGLIEYNRYRRGKRSLTDRSHGVTPTLFWCVGALVVFALNLIYLISRHELVSAYKNNRYSIVEGNVFVIHEQPQTGHDIGDIIKVDDMEFIIDYTGMTNGYKQTIAYGGVLNNGVYARIYHYDGKILRIDIKEKQPP